MVEADDAGDLPHSVLVLPEVDEFGLADGAGFFVSGVMETVDADLDRAVVGNGIDLERAGDEFTGDLATDIVLDSLDESRASAAQAGFVVIELDIVGDQRSEFFQIAVVVGVEELGIQRLDGLEERVGEGAVWEWAKAVASKAATRTACTRTVAFFIRGSFFLREICHLIVRANGGDGSAIPVLPIDDAGEQQVSPLRLLRCAPVEMTVIGRIEGGCLGSHFSRRTREMGQPRFS